MTREAGKRERKREREIERERQRERERMEGKQQRAKVSQSNFVPR